MQTGHDPLPCGMLGQLLIHSHGHSPVTARWQIPFLDCLLFGHVLHPSEQPTVDGIAGFGGF